MPYFCLLISARSSKQDYQNSQVEARNLEYALHQDPATAGLATAGLATADFRYRRSNFWGKNSKKREICPIFRKYLQKCQNLMK